MKYTYNHVGIIGRCIHGTIVGQQRGWCFRRHKTRDCAVFATWIKARIWNKEFHENELGICRRGVPKSFKDFNTVEIGPIVKDVLHEEDRNFSLRLSGKEILGYEIT